MLPKDKWIKTVYRPYPPLMLSMELKGTSELDNYRVFLPNPIAVKNYVEVDHILYYERQNQENMAKAFFEQWLDPKRLKYAKEEFDKREKNLLISAKKSFVEFDKALRYFMPALEAFWIQDNLIIGELKAKLDSKISKSEIDNLLNRLNVPLKDNLYKQEEYDLVMTDDLPKHVKKYVWIRSRYGQDIDYTVEEACPRKQQINKKEFLDGREKTRDETLNTIAEAKRLLGVKDASLVDLMQYLIYYRTHRTDRIYQAMYFQIPNLKLIAAKQHLTYEQLLFCLRDEVVSNKYPSAETINERQTNHALIMEEGKIWCAVGKESDQTRKFFSDFDPDTNEIRGVVASPGKVSGTIRIVKDFADFIKVNDGDIIVTFMTTPPMMPILTKAAAFITDEGGITCHAAIISREMKKPCIIGTQKATKVLKDGDTVEVDADKGIIKIIHN